MIDPVTLNWLILALLVVGSLFLAVFCVVRIGAQSDEYQPKPRDQRRSDDYDGGRGR